MYLIHAREKYMLEYFCGFVSSFFVCFYIYILNQPALKTRTELPCNL